MAEYIDRVALLSQYTGNILTAQIDYAEGLRDAIQDIKDAPVADVAPVIHGRWIYGEDMDIKCSHCGKDALTEGDYRQVESNYCPNCGAKMDWAG